jgi:hypothetical protein
MQESSVFYRRRTIRTGRQIVTPAQVQRKSPKVLTEQEPENMPERACRQELAKAWQAGAKTSDKTATKA